MALCSCLLWCVLAQANTNSEYHECPIDVSLEKVDEEVKTSLTALQNTAASREVVDLGTLGMAYEMNGFPRAAFSCYVECEQLEPSNPIWSYFQALLHAARGETASAIERVTHSLSIDSGYAPAWMWLGEWNLELNELESAKSAYENAYTNGEKEASQIGLARVYMAMDLPLKVINQLADLRGSEIHPYVAGLLGRAYQQLQDSEAASEFFRLATNSGIPGWYDSRSMQKQKFSFSISAQLGQIRAQLKSPLDPLTLDRAENLHRKYHTYKGTLTTAIEANRLAGNIERVRELLNEGIQQFPDYALLYELLGEFHIAQNDYSAAKKQFLRAIELGSEEPWLYIQLGIVFLQEGQTETAHSYFQGAIELDATNPLPHYWQGLIHFATGNNEQADQSFRESIKLDTEFVDGYIGLVKVLIKQSQLTEANQLLQQLIELGVDLTEVGVFQGEIERLSTVHD